MGEKQIKKISPQKNLIIFHGAWDPPRTLHKLGKCSITELYPQTLYY
jgi:hypothetical protein